MSQKPELTVVIPSLNRPDILKRNLLLLAREQDLEPDRFEVIVVQDGCTQEYRDAFAAVEPELPYAVTFLQNDEHRGPGYTQNRGIRLARAPLVLILADDVLLANGALQAHLDKHRDNPEDGVAVLGKVLQSPELDDTVFLQNWDPFGFIDREHITELPYHMFWACNISVKKRFLEKHGMFREHRGRAADGRGGGGAAHEDVELGYRLRNHGLRILYSKEAWGYHHHVYRLNQAIARYYERGVNWGEFYQHAPDPQLLVANHVLTAKTLGEYARGLRLSGLRGREGSLAWHLIRHGLLMLAFNRVTEPLVWRPLLEKAEKSPFYGRMMSRHVYRAFLYYHFLRGIRDGDARFRRIDNEVSDDLSEANAGSD